MKTKLSDVVITGGGLAGLCLAKQLKQAHSDLDIVVLEKNQFPRPQAIAKVGESTVEIGGHYLSETMGLKGHLDDRHLRKFGLRCYFGKNEQFSELDELGPSKNFSIPTYQIDRGELENRLFKDVTDLGVRIEQGTATESIHLNSKIHQCVTNTAEKQQTTFEAPWILDASGRQGLLKQTLGHQKTNSHQGKAVWFRVDKRIEIDNWSKDEQWHKQCSPQKKRWLSTNHLMGPGYWVWVIPLYDNITSIGIVMDDQVEQGSSFDTIEQTMDWLTVNQPLCANAIGSAKIMDFIKIRDYSYDCKQVFSSDGWAMTGEAGVFTDPFYSPGSDFIAISNQYITNLVGQSKQGKNIGFDAAIYQKLYQSIYASTLSLYTNQYGGFGDRRMMSMKLLWDFTYYWGVLSLLYFRGSLTNIGVMREASLPIIEIREVNNRLQAQFSEMAKQRIIRPTKGVFLDQNNIPVLRHLNDLLKEPGDVNCIVQLNKNIALLKRISVIITDVLHNKPVTLEERELLADYGTLAR